MADVKRILKSVPKDPKGIRSASTEGMSPPVFQFVPTRLALSAPLNTAQVIQSDPDDYFATPVMDVLNNELFNPLKCHVAMTAQTDRLGDEHELLMFQPVLITGDDVLISHILTSYIISYKRDPMVHRLAFTWYVIPTSADASNEIASHLGSVDPIYHKFVEKAFLCARQIGPLYSDGTIVELDSIVGDSPITSTNPWLADPSPSNLFQFSLHHYLTFAQSATLISVWKCVLKFADRTFIAVPWIISVRVGDSFENGGDAWAFPKAPIAIEGAETIGSGRKAQAFAVQESQLHSFAAWNVNRERRLKGNADWIVAEWTRDKDLKTPESRLAKPAAFVTKTVAKITVTSGHPFDLMIDQRLYMKVYSMVISPMEESIISPSNPEPRQVQVRFATFNPPM
jgi:hypothetical protein